MADSPVSDRHTSLEDIPLIIDADSHMGESVEGLVEFIDERYSWAREMISRSDAPRREVYHSSQQTPQFSHRIGQRMDLYKQEEEEYDLEIKLAEMEDLGIDFSILNPGINLDHHTITNTQFSIALMGAYNRWLVDQQLEDGPFKGTILVSAMAPEKSAEEIDRWADEQDIVGVSLPAVGITPPPGDPSYDPIYEAAEDNGLPISFHGGSGSTLYGWPTIGRWSETFSEAHVMVHPMTAMWNLTTMVLRGVPERFPNLDIVFQESGIGWIPYMKWRLDDHFLENAEEMPVLEKMPSQYIDDQFYFTTQPIGHTESNPEHLAHMFDLVGPASIMYSADIPHADHDPPSEVFDRIRGHFDANTVEDVMGGTAARLYDIG
jgi:predicted TIM-barrel fold metal-dependent hydrolase